MAKYTASVVINAKSNIKGVAKKVKSGIAGITHSLKKNSKEWKKAGSIAKKSTKVMVAGSAAAGVAVVALTKATANYGDNLAKTAQKTGIAVEQLQSLRYSAQLGGAELKDLDTGVRVFSRSIDEASQGTAEYKESFDRLGISVVGADGKLKKTPALLKEVADRFSRMEDGAAKASLAQQLFGRGGSALIPMLNQGSAAIEAQAKEFENIGFVMSADQAKASETFNDDLLRLTTTIKGIGLAIGVEFMPHMNSMINALTENLQPLKEAISGNEDLRDILKDIGDLVKSIDFAGMFEGAMDYLKDFIEGIKVIKGVFDSMTKTESQEELAKSRMAFYQNGGNGLIQGVKTITDDQGNTVSINMKIDKDGNPIEVKSESKDTKMHVSLPYMTAGGIM